MGSRCIFRVYYICEFGIYRHKNKESFEIIKDQTFFKTINDIKSNLRPKLLRK